MTFAVLALICAVALLGPLIGLTRRVRVPVVIVELVVGIVIGKTGFGLVDYTNPTFAFLAEVGFALVMFVAGTHVPVRDPAMRRGLRNGALRAVAIGVLAVPMGLLVASVFGTGHGWLYAVLIASSSASIVIPALGGATVSSRPGVEMLAQLAIADASCIVVLPLVIEPQHAARAALGAVAVIAVAVVFFALLNWAERSGRRRRLHDASETRHLAIELRVTLTMLFTLAAIAATMKVSVMLAGFAMGLAMTAAGEPKRVANQAFALTEGLFGPIFFVWLGASLDLRELATHPQTVLLGLALGLGAVVVHGVLALTRQPWPIAVATAAQLGVPIGAVALGKTLGLLVDGEGTAMLLGALVTIVGVTLVTGRLARVIGDAAPDQHAPATQPGRAG